MRVALISYNIVDRRWNLMKTTQFVIVFSLTDEFVQSLKSLKSKRDRLDKSREYLEERIAEFKKEFPESMVQSKLTGVMGMVVEVSDAATGFEARFKEKFPKYSIARGDHRLQQIV